MDSASRLHAAQQRLAALERDNDAEDEELERPGDEAYEDDEEEEVLVGAARGKGGKGKGKGGKGRAGPAVGGARRRRAEAEAVGRQSKRARQSLEAIVTRLGMREEGGGAAVPNYVTAGCGPCSHPPRAFCSVCGYRSAYVCVRCGLRYCSIPCQRTHHDTRCSKFAT